MERIFDLVRAPEERRLVKNTGRVEVTHPRPKEGHAVCVMPSALKLCVIAHVDRFELRDGGLEPACAHQCLGAGDAIGDGRGGTLLELARDLSIDRPRGGNPRRECSVSGVVVPA